MKREISNSQLLFISFAAIFGSGWLFAPLYAAQIAGPSSLIAWCIGALMSAVIGITMAEVVALYPKTGGLPQIAKITHGDLLSICITTLNLLVFIILPAIEVRAVVQYLSSYFHFLLNGEDRVSLIGYFIALLLLTLITLVNIYGARITASVTKIVVLFKVITPALVCISFLYVLKSLGHLDHSRLVLSGTSALSIPWAQVFQAIATSGIIFSFNGFNQATLFAGEAKNPQKAIPFAILGSLLVSGLLYLLVQYVFLMAVPDGNLVHGWEKLTFAGDQGPFAGIAALLGLGWLLAIIYVDAFVSPLGTAFTYASAAPRLFYVLAESSPQLFPLFKPNKYGIAPFSIGLTLVLECIAFLLLPNLKAMISILVAAFVLCYTIAPASLLLLRKIRPKMDRPFRVFWAPFVSYLSLFFSNLMVYSCGWIALRNLIILSTGLIGFFLLFSKKNEGVRSFLKGSEWFIFELCSITVLSYLNQVHPTPFSYVVGWIGCTSFFALFLSQTVVPVSTKY